MAGLALRSLDIKLATFRRSAACLGIELRTVHTTTRFRAPARCFSSVVSARKIKENGVSEFDDSLMSSPEPAPQNTLNSDATLPWYLQVPPPRQKLAELHPFADRQKLPELPTDPPPSLQSMLEHISVELGLDDLAILDLRSIDPPPALGANLIMVVGTARSEKHLHVSADRFCRWLRSTHKMRPTADGLLGRNELKLKMKRKNRRSRLLASIGAAARDEDVDDGIKTGWICVRVGRVEPAPVIPNVAEDEREFVGFGETSRNVTIVVQMFTNEKREEVYLEGLWQDVLDRVKRREQRTGSSIQAVQDIREELEDTSALEAGDLRAQSHIPSELQRTVPQL